jgi:DNA repair ATPase RecN
MAKRKDFVSDGLVTLRHKYVDEHLNALKGDNDISASYVTPDVDKNLSIQEQQIQMYHQIRNDLDIRLNQQLAALETQIDLEKQDLNKCEAAYGRFEKLIEKFGDLPKSIEFEEHSEALTRLEQLRVEFFSAKAARARRDKVSPVVNTNSPQISLLPELNSLHQLQMFKMGLCFALPLIIGVIVGCSIIAWAIVITWGG